MNTGHMILTIALAAVGSGGIGGAVTHALGRVFSGKVGTKIMHVAEEAAPVIKVGVTAVEDLLKLPELAGVKKKVGELESELTQSQIFKATDAVMHNLAVKVEDISPETENAIALAITTQVQKLFGKTVTVAQVVSTIDEMKKLAQKVAPEPAVQAAKQLAAPTDGGQASATAAS